MSLLWAINPSVVLSAVRSWMAGEDSAGYTPLQHDPGDQRCIEDFIEDKELLISIFSWLEWEDLPSASMVCRRWWVICRDPGLRKLGTGRLYSYGYGCWGRLGHGSEEDVCRPKFVSSFKGKTVLDASAGGLHSLAVCDDGSLYAWGFGCGGRLGLGNQKSSFLPKQITALSHVRAVSVAAGNDHSLVLTDSGQVYSFGNGDDSQLGHNNQNCIVLPQQISIFKGANGPVKISQVSAGYDHSLLLSEDGQVFAFGNGTYGKLGLGCQTAKSVPTLITALQDKNVASVHCGMYHNLVVTACGRVYSFGNGSSGQLGHRSKKDRLVPKRIRALRDVHCVTASGGWNHSLVATLDGRVFSFGDGSNGKLGHGNDASQATPLPILALGALFVVEVAAGDGYSLVATDKGKILPLVPQPNLRAPQMDRRRSTKRPSSCRAQSRPFREAVWL